MSTRHKRPTTKSPIESESNRLLRSNLETGPVQTNLSLSFSFLYFKVLPLLSDLLRYSTERDFHWPLQQDSSGQQLEQRPIHLSRLLGDQPASCKLLVVLRFEFHLIGASWVKLFHHMSDTSASDKRGNNCRSKSMKWLCWLLTTAIFCGWDNKSGASFCSRWVEIADKSSRYAIKSAEMAIKVEAAEQDLAIRSCPSAAHKKSSATFHRRMFDIRPLFVFCRRQLHLTNCCRSLTFYGTKVHNIRVIGEKLWTECWKLDWNASRPQPKRIVSKRLTLLMAFFPLFTANVTAFEQHLTTLAVTNDLKCVNPLPPNSWLARNKASTVPFCPHDFASRPMDSQSIAGRQVVRRAINGAPWKRLTVDPLLRVKLIRALRR